ncbi:hypothetical protein [Peribacillus sp. NPDC056705]|uniref:hypothetical protein n=1 Tax=Peribacillus sp. NPDC056705 TaxID=3345918 RepID=UPI00374A0CF7
MKMFRVILALVIIVLSGYSLITETLELMQYYVFFLGALMLMTGLAELKKIIVHADTTVIDNFRHNVRNAKGMWSRATTIILQLVRDLGQD